MEAGEMEISHQKNRLRLSDGRGFDHTFSALWLRESSFDPEFRDPKTGHKLGDGDTLPLDIEIRSSRIEDDTLFLAFSDGHACEFSIDWLIDAAARPTYPELAGEKLLWDAGLDPLPWYDLSDLQSDPARLRDALNDVARLGFMLVRGIPERLDGLRDFTDLIGLIRVTNNGGIQDIKAIAPEKAYDLSMTPQALEPHTDNPYRVPQPGYVLLHCLENSAEGGESGLTDGFRAAEELRRESRELFDALVATPVNWFYRDEQAILEDVSSFIETNHDGSIKHVRFHGRSDRVAAVDADQLDRFYAARRRFISLIASDELELRFKLGPGEMFMVDNHRMIHSRKTFRLQTGARHMRQAYLDRDVVSSRQKTLNRSLDAKPWQAR
jgi:gamma-butyrobetaine dioxygenase